MGAGVSPAFLYIRGNRMNKDKIQRVIDQINKSIDAISDANLEDLTNDDLEFDGFVNKVTGNYIYNEISSAYQQMDDVVSKLVDLLED